MISPTFGRHDLNSTASLGMWSAVTPRVSALPGMVSPLVRGGLRACAFASGGGSGRGIDVHKQHLCEHTTSHVCGGPFLLQRCKTDRLASATSTTRPQMRWAHHTPRQGARERRRDGGSWAVRGADGGGKRQDPRQNRDGRGAARVGVSRTSHGDRDREASTLEDASPDMFNVTMNPDMDAMVSTGCFSYFHYF